MYADANDRGIHTTLYLVEATGALCPELVANLRHTLQGGSRLHGPHGHTVFNTDRSSRVAAAAYSWQSHAGSFMLAVHTGSLTLAVSR